jgi:hypothetical protein
MSDAEAWRAELQAHKRRLAILKEQAAIQGISREPRLDIEIEDIERQISDLQRKLGLVPDTGLTPAEPAAVSPPISAGRDAIVANISGSSKDGWILRISGRRAGLCCLGLRRERQQMAQRPTNHRRHLYSQCYNYTSG